MKLIKTNWEDKKITNEVDKLISTMMTGNYLLRKSTLKTFC